MRRRPMAAWLLVSALLLTSGCWDMQSLDIYAVASIYFTAALLMAEVFNRKTIRPFMLVAAVISLLPQYFLPTSARGIEFAYDSVIRGLVISAVTFTVFWIVYWLRSVSGKVQNGTRRAPSG